MEDLLYKIALTRIPFVGPITTRQLVSYCGSPKAVFECRLRELLHVPGVGRSIAETIIQKKTFPEAEAQLVFLEKTGTRVLFYLDSDYPMRLKNQEDSPILLYYQGKADLNAPRMVSIVGTRRPSPYGVAFCEELVSDLAAYGVAIVSGLAFGIDIAAHRRCVELNLPTVGVLGHGLDHIYPFQHRSIAERMATGCGGLLSEFPFETKPEREHFPMRNRIIAGLCDALVVVETGLRGGSMISAEMANAYHKDVFAVPGRVRDKQSGGCHLLIKTHRAALLESAADLASSMRWVEPKASQGVQGELFPELSEEEKIIVDLLNQGEAVHIDRLTVAARLSSSTMASLLLHLEFKGVVKALPGKCFTLVGR